MSFTSIEFLVFLPLAAAIFFIIPHARRWIWLLATSVFFFCYVYYTTYDPARIPYYVFIFLSVVSVILIDYVLGISIESRRQTEKIKSRVLLVIGIIYPIVLLILFKYLNFFDSVVADCAAILHLHYPRHVLELIAPIGISYYTFQSISYLIEVHRGTIKAERHLGILSLYFIFFPKLIIGPIERPQNLIPQFYREQKFEYRRVVDGMKLMAWGFFKKLVIADRLAIVVNEVFNSPHDYWGIYFIIGACFFSIQIYCDFSGYTDIAIGAGEVFGFRLMENFRRPFLAPTIADLWRRWHISLVSWFRDYVYIPLGGNRVSKLRWQFNMFLTFILSGIWHGANWTFLIWAALNGFYVLVSDWTAPIRHTFRTLLHFEKFPRIHLWMGRLFTFLLFSFAAIFFRANSTYDALYIVRHLFTRVGATMLAFIRLDFIMVKSLLIVPTKNTIFGFSKPAFSSEMIMTVGGLAALLFIEVLQEKTRLRTLISGKPWYLRWSLYILLLYSIFFLGVFANQQFLYFKFR